VPGSIIFLKGAGTLPQNNSKVKHVPKVKKANNFLEFQLVHSYRVASIHFRKENIT
jgi:hypothetical protein